MSGNAWFKARRRLLISLHGGGCKVCGVRVGLDFAHKHAYPTNLKGPGRGRNMRVLDVLRYPFAYVLLCKAHHAAYDRGLIEM